MLIERRKCTKEGCGKTHRLLPGNKVLPYKQYDADTIEGVIDGVVNEENLSMEDYPCESTLSRWREWAEELLRNTDGQLRSKVHRVYDLHYEFLKCGNSLLKELKKRIKYGWLTAVVRIYMDTGGI